MQRNPPPPEPLLLVFLSPSRFAVPCPGVLDPRLGGTPRLATTPPGVPGEANEESEPGLDPDGEPFELPKFSRNPRFSLEGACSGWETPVGIPGGVCGLAATVPGVLGVATSESSPGLDPVGELFELLKLSLNCLILSEIA